MLLEFHGSLQTQQEKKFNLTFEFQKFNKSLRKLEKANVT